VLVKVYILKPFLFTNNNVMRSRLVDTKKQWTDTTHTRTHIYAHIRSHRMPKRYSAAQSEEARRL